MITILITYFNELELLKRCLASLNSQTLLPTEVIIYDDCSAEQLRIEQLPSYIYPIKIINAKVNMGPGHGRNNLMKLCKTQYFRFQDADDELFNNALESISKAIIENDYPELLLNEISSFDEKNKLQCEKVIGLDNFDNDLINFSISHVLLIPSVTYKTKFARSIVGFKPREILAQSEDSDFIRRLSLVCKSYIIINNPLAKQNLRVNSHSHSNQKDVWISGYLSLYSIKNDLNVRSLVHYAKKMHQIGINLLEHGSLKYAKLAFNEIKPIISKSKILMHSRKKRVVVKIIGIYYTELLAYYLRKLKDDQRYQIFPTRKRRIQ